MRRPDFQRPTFRPKRSAQIIALLLSLSGCAIGPDYQRLATNLPETFNRAVDADVNLPTSLAETPIKAWWLLFQDEELNQLVVRAQTYNFDLRLAVARIEEAEGVMREVGAAFFPEINASSGASRTQASTRNAIPLPSTAPRLQDNRNAALATSFEIDLWGKLRRANQAARADLLSSRYARDTVELTVAGLVTSNYLNLRALDANLILTRSTLDSRQKALEIVKSLVAGGRASALDLYQAEGVLAAAQAQLAELRRQRALAESQLALLTGQPGLRLAAGDLRQIPLPPVPPPGLPSSLLENRPDIRQAEETLISANARIGVAKAALFPSVSLTGSMGSSSVALANLFSSGAGIGSLGLATTMPIFDAGRNFARIDQVSARQKQALVNYQKTVETAFKEVNDALVSVYENSQSEEAQQRRVQTTGKSLELAQLRYEAGYSASIEVLDAQRSANDALLSYVAIRQARLNSTVELFKSLGGGWKDGNKVGS